MIYFVSQCFPMLQLLLRWTQNKKTPANNNWKDDISEVQHLFISPCRLQKLVIYWHTQMMLNLAVRYLQQKQFIFCSQTGNVLHISFRHFFFLSFHCNLLHNSVSIFSAFCKSYVFYWLSKYCLSLFHHVIIKMLQLFLLFYFYLFCSNCDVW